MKTTIALRHLTTGFKGKPVTEDINADLYAGELTCLLGPNGAGKSTLLKTLAAFIPPLSGEIAIDGTPLHSIKPAALARRIGVVLTERPAGMNMTVRQLVEIGRSPYTSFFGGLGDRDRRIVDEAISMVGIEALASRPVHSLSDGERQKSLIAKALAQQTDIILLDEPTAFLDYTGKMDLLNLLHRIAHEEGKTVLLSTHDLELALQISDKAWLLERRLLIDTPRRLLDSGAIEACFRIPDRQIAGWKLLIPQ